MTPEQAIKETLTKPSRKYFKPTSISFERAQKACEIYAQAVCGHKQIFTLNEKEQACYDALSPVAIEFHNGAIGRRILVTVKNGEKKDITDYHSW